MIKPNTNTDADADATDYETNLSPPSINNDSVEYHSVTIEISNTEVPQELNDYFSINKAKDGTNENDQDEISKKPKSVVTQPNNTSDSKKDETEYVEAKSIKIPEEANDLTSCDKKNDETQDTNAPTEPLQADNEQRSKDTPSSSTDPPQSNDNQSKSGFRRRYKTGQIEIRQVDIDVEHADRANDNETAALLESNNENEDSIEEYDIEAPNDVYSILLITPSLCSCNFFFVALVFLAQFFLQFLILVSFFEDLYFGEDSYKKSITLEDAPTDVRIAQVFAIFIALITADDALSSLGMMSMVPIGYEHIPCYMRLSSFGLRLAEGVFGIVISLYIIMSSDNTITMFSEFAAMAFVNTIDNVLFYMCQANFITRKLRKTVREVKKLEFGRESMWSIYFRRAVVICAWAALFYIFYIEGVLTVRTYFVCSSEKEECNRLSVHGMCAMGECGSEAEMMFRNGESYSSPYWLPYENAVYLENYRYNVEDYRYNTTEYVPTDRLDGVIYFCKNQYSNGRWYIGVVKPKKIYRNTFETDQNCYVDGKPWIYRSEGSSSLVTDVNFWNTINSTDSYHLDMKFNDDMYGLRRFTTTYDPGCAYIHTSKDADFDFLGNFTIRRNGEGTIYGVYGRFVYFNGDKLIFSVGPNWIMTTSKLVPSLNETDHHSFWRFHALHHQWNALYVSEPTTSDSPSNLQWFTKPNGTINKDDLINGDYEYPVKGTFLCGQCVNDKNTVCDAKVMGGHASITIENNDHINCEYEKRKLYNKNTTLYSDIQLHNNSIQMHNEVWYGVNNTHFYIEYHVLKKYSNITNSNQDTETNMSSSILLSVTRNGDKPMRIESTVVIESGKAEMYYSSDDKSNPKCMVKTELEKSTNLFYYQPRKVYIKFDVEFSGSWKD